MVEGPIRGAPLDAGPPGAAAGAAEEPPPEPAPGPASTQAPLPEGTAAAEPPAPPPAIPRAAAENPAHGVKASAPADLPAGTRYIAFDDVSWPEYEPPELRAVDEEQLALSDFPERIQALNGVRAAFDGYMVPVDFSNRKVTSFILSRYVAGCCFGAMPRLDEWVEVQVGIEGGVDYIPFQAVRVTGPFEVGEVLDDYGYVRSLYRMKAESVEDQL